MVFHAKGLPLRPPDRHPDDRRSQGADTHFPARRVPHGV